MDITIANFDENLTDITASIDSCSFLSVDCEFTGIASANCHFTDTPQERYSRLREGTRDYLLAQFGLCTFSEIDSNRYVCNGYNFYIFPNKICKGAPNRVFSSEASSLAFLIANGFDFNKVIKEGIPYLTIDEEEQVKDDLESRQREFLSKAQCDKIPIPDEMKRFIEGICSRIKEFQAGTEASLNITECRTGFQRKLLFQEINDRFPDLIVRSVLSEKKETMMVVSRPGNGTQNALEQQHEQNLQDLEANIGFSKVIRKIINSNKLVVGHNLLLDILCSINQFCTPLPESYADFKTLVASLFPKILDTKVIAAISPLKDIIENSGLADLRDAILKKPFHVPPIEFRGGGKVYDLQSGSFHDACYDAFVTGVCLISMNKYLDKSVPQRQLNLSPVIHKYLNKMKVQYILDVPYLDLGGEDVIPSRDHVFHVLFSKSVTLDSMKQTLHQMFSPFGNIRFDVVDDKSAFVALLDKEKASIATKGIHSRARKASCTVTPFDRYKRASEPRKRKGSPDDETPVEKPDYKRVNSGATTNGSNVQETDTQQQGPGETSGSTPSAAPIQQMEKPFIEDAPWE